MKLALVALSLLLSLGMAIAHSVFFACGYGYERAVALVCLEDKYGENFINDFEEVLYRTVTRADESDGLTFDEKLRGLYRIKDWTDCPIWVKTEGLCCRAGCYKPNILKVCHTCFPGDKNE